MNRSTFLEYQEVLLKLAERCRGAETQLRDAMGHADEAMLPELERIAHAEAALADSLEEYTREGPPGLLLMRMQYLTDEPEETDASASLEQAVSNVAEANDAIAELLEQQSEKVAAESAREEVLRLKEKVDTVSRQISFMRLADRDL